MNGWNFSIDTAPRDGSQFLMATTDGKRFLTKWLEPTKFTPNGRFDGFSENAKTLLAWVCVPDHPKFLTKAEEGAEAKGTATADPVSRAEAETDRQRSSEAGPTDGRRQGGVEHLTAVDVPDHFIIEDCGGGE